MTDDAMNAVIVKREQFTLEEAVERFCDVDQYPRYTISLLTRKQKAFSFRQFKDAAIEKVGMDRYLEISELRSYGVACHRASLAHPEVKTIIDMFYNQGMTRAKIVEWASERRKEWLDKGIHTLSLERIENILMDYAAKESIDYKAVLYKNRDAAQSRTRKNSPYHQAVVDAFKDPKHEAYRNMGKARMVVNPPMGYHNARSTIIAFIGRKEYDRFVKQGRKSPYHQAVVDAFTDKNGDAYCSIEGARHSVKPIMSYQNARSTLITFIGRKEYDRLIKQGRKSPYHQAVVDAFTDKNGDAYCSIEGARHSVKPIMSYQNARHTLITFIGRKEYDRLIKKGKAGSVVLRIRHRSPYHRAVVDAFTDKNGDAYCNIEKARHSVKPVMPHQDARSTIIASIGKDEYDRLIKL